MQKTFRFIWLMALPMMLGLASCAEKDSPVNTNPNPLAQQVSGLWWSLVEQEGSYSDATDTFDYTRLGMALNFNDDGTGYGIVFLFNNDESNPIENIGGEGFGKFTYTTTADGRITMDFSNAGKASADYFKKWAMTYANGAVSATDGKLTLTLEKPTDIMAGNIRYWDELFNGGAEAAPYHNINDAAFTADTWREQGGIYIWDGSKELTEDNWQDKKNYKLVDLPWSGTSDVLTNLPDGFCDNITPDNGWEWVINRCGGSKIPNNNFFAVYNKYSGILRFFFYMSEKTNTPGNDHVWQVSLTNTLADNSMWGYGLPSAETAKDRSKLSKTGNNVQVDYVAPWVEMKSSDGLIVPNAGWWAFDVDLSQYRPNHDITNENIRLQMRAWNSSHVSLFSTLTAKLDGSIKQVAHTNSGSTVAKGVCIGLQAAVGITAAVAGGASGNPQAVATGLGNLANAFGAGAQLAGLFDDGNKPFEAQVSLGLNGTINTDGILKGSASAINVPSPTLQLKDFYLSNSHIGQGVWNIKHHPVVHVFKDAKYFHYSSLTGFIDEAFSAIPYVFDPSSIEVELNPEIFPSDQIEWMQVDATCVADNKMQADGTDKFRTGLGLQSRHRGKLGTDAKTFVSNGYPIQKYFDFDKAYKWTESDMIHFFDYLGYYADRSQAEKEENPMYYPILAWKNNGTSRDREYIIGRGQTDGFAIEPLMFKELDGVYFALPNQVKSQEVEIWLPSVEVNVCVTVKMKGIKEPYIFSRNYLPEFNDVKFSDIDALVTSIKSHKLSDKQSGHDYSYKYQVERIEKLFKDMKAKFE